MRSFLPFWVSVATTCVATWYTHAKKTADEKKEDSNQGLISLYWNLNEGFDPTPLPAPLQHSWALCNPSLKNACLEKRDQCIRLLETEHLLNRIKYSLVQTKQPICVPKVFHDGWALETTRLSGSAEKFSRRKRSLARIVTRMKEDITLEEKYAAEEYYDVAEDTDNGEKEYLTAALSDFDPLSDGVFLSRGSKRHPVDRPIEIDLKERLKNFSWDENMENNFPVYYEGILTWNNDTRDEPCVLNDAIGRFLLSDMEKSKKVEWAVKKKSQICDYHKFQKCLLVPRSQALYLHDAETEEYVPRCRCFYDDFVLDGDKCYIPAQAGLLSACDYKEMYPPAGSWDFKLPPFLIPSCTPNSLCSKGAYFSGSRCLCVGPYILNEETHKCSQGILDIEKTPIQIFFLIIFIFFLNLYFSIII